MRISIFITCFNDTLFPETGKAMVRLLERLGHTVDFPFEQTCCGQMHYNTGYQEEAIPLARKFTEVFGEADYVVAPSASCVAMIHEFYPKIAERSGDSQLKNDIDAMIPKVFELSQFLVDEIGVEDVGAYYPHKVTYHPTCHSLRMLHVGEAPLKLLRKVKGLELQELPGALECCGFGGTFAVKNAETSEAMLIDKMDQIEGTGAGVCTSIDNSCLMHIGGGLSRKDSRTRVVHLAEILASTQEPI